MNIMKKIVAVALVVSMLAMSAAFAESFVKFTGNAHCYKKAGSGETETVIKKGSVAEKVDTKGGYTQVKVNGKTKLWVKSELVKADKKAKASKIAFSEGGSKLSKEGKAHGVKGYSKVVSKGKCNIRTKASLSGKSLGTFKKGETLKFTGKVSRDSRGIDWYSVRTKNGANAWVSSVYTALEK